MGEYADFEVDNAICEDWGRTEYRTAKKKYLWIDAKTLHKTEMATLFELHNGHRQWIPNSVFVQSSRLDGIGVPEWFVDQTANKFFVKYEKEIQLELDF